MEEKEIKEQAFEFAEQLRKVIPYYGFSKYAIYLIFMKYVSEFDNVQSPEQFKILMTYKNMFIKKEFSKEITANAFKVMNDIYNIENNLLVKCIPFLEEIFKDNDEFLFDVLNFLELKENNKYTVSFINQILDYNDGDLTKSLSYQTNESLSNLVVKILNVKENEIYFDPFCGFNRTAFGINASEYLGYELFGDVAIAANMIMIILEKQNFHIYACNSYDNENYSIADKVFCDGSIGLKLKKSDVKFLEKGGKSSEYYNIKLSLDSLKENGLAVITVPSRVLFNSLYINLRTELTASKLKAVIALPPLWSGTSINTNLLVFENNKKDSDIVMIDASNEQYLNKISNKNYQLKNEIIEKIIDSLNGIKIEEFSSIITIKDILDNEEISWQPQLYIKKKLDKVYRPSNEIKKDLNKSYNELLNLIKNG